MKRAIWLLLSTPWTCLLKLIWITVFMLLVFTLNEYTYFLNKIQATTIGCVDKGIIDIQFLRKKPDIIYKIPFIKYLTFNVKVSPCND